jgi:pyruvate formate lyase activating enzyme
MVGRRMGVAAAMEEIRRDRTFHDESGGGITFSGGEPLMQFEFLREMLIKCRQEGIHTALDTCGHAPREQLLGAAMLSDLVLYDLKMVDDRKHRKYTGVSNVRILENLRAVSEAHPRIWIRMPVIPGINDGDEDVRAAAEFVVNLKGVQRVCLLPYHSTGEAKGRRLGREDRMAGTRTPDSDTMQRIAARFGKLGLDVNIGG